VKEPRREKTVRADSARRRDDSQPGHHVVARKDKVLPYDAVKGQW